MNLSVVLFIALLNNVEPFVGAYNHKERTHHDDGLQHGIAPYIVESYLNLLHQFNVKRTLRGKARQPVITKAS